MGNVCVFIVTFDANVAFVAQTYVKYLDGFSVLTQKQHYSLYLISRRNYTESLVGLEGHFMTQLDVPVSY